MSDLRQRLYDAMMGQPAYSVPPSEYTTTGDARRERISNAMGWDVGPGGWDPAYAGRELGNRAWQLGLSPGVGGAARVASAVPRVVPQTKLWEDVVALRARPLIESGMNMHMNPWKWARTDLPQLVKGAGAVGAAGGAGAAAGSYITDRLAYGLDPSEASWRAAHRAVRNPIAVPPPPPSWWPGAQ